MGTRRIVLKEDNQDSVHSPLKSGLQFGVIGTLLLLVVLTPSYFTTSLSTYNIPKIALVQILTTLACSLWFIRMAIDGKLSLVQSPLYYAFLSFLAANFISSLPSIQPSRRLGDDVPVYL